MSAYPSGFQPYRNSHFQYEEWEAAGYDRVTAATQLGAGQLAQQLGALGQMMRQQLGLTLFAVGKNLLNGRGDLHVPLPAVAPQRELGRVVAALVADAVRDARLVRRRQQVDATIAREHAILRARRRDEFRHPRRTDRRDGVGPNRRAR